ncbi:hypothetical protein ACC672_36960, partial [Rhizobium ruizarguesonis]
GAILMTPTIAVDALFSCGSPDAVQDGAALDLLPFEFFPHLNDDPGYISALLRYSETTATPILACRDGSTIAHLHEVGNGRQLAGEDQGKGW